MCLVVSMKPTRIHHMQPASPLKNILISLFHRELNAIDRSGPFKISTSISISSSNTHTLSLSPQVMTVLGLGELARAVCLRFEVFLAASSPPCSPLLNNGNQPILVSFTEGMNKCRTHLLWPLLSAPPPPPTPPLLIGSIPICIWNALDHLDWKSWLFSGFALQGNQACRDSFVKALSRAHMHGTCNPFKHNSDSRKKSMFTNRGQHFYTYALV